MDGWSQKEIDGRVYRGDDEVSGSEGKEMNHAKSGSTELNTGTSVVSLTTFIKMYRKL